MGEADSGRFCGMVEISRKRHFVPAKFRLKAARIIAQWQVRGTANGALGSTDKQKFVL